ncbi:MAG: hypothetical protein K1X36_04000 [Pyrinomonadaceae bacterium]|nr:hypothetical protein [Pyrinomonadaceae bacterium]
MGQNFQAGDFLAFQLEAGFALLRLLHIEESGGEKTWHLAAYADMFPDIESAEAAAASVSRLQTSSPHMALTTRAFESTQVARLVNVSLTESELEAFNSWRTDPERAVSDRSVRLMLGLR